MIKCKSTGEEVLTYKQYLLTKHWEKKKKSFKCTVKHECMKCKSKHNLQVHHLTYKNIGDERHTQLCLLCKDCHFSAHENGIDALDKIKADRKIQRRMDIMRIRHGRNWLIKLGFNDEEEWFLNLIKEQERSKIDRIKKKVKI